MTDDELVTALQRARLARALNPADDEIRRAAAKLDMTVADALRLVASMLDNLTEPPTPTLH